MPMKTLGHFLGGLFPFAAIVALMGPVAPAFLALSLFLAAMYTLCRRHETEGRRPSRRLSRALALYFIVLFALLFFMFRMAVYYQAAILLPAALAAAALTAAGKIRVNTAAGILLNLSTIFVFLLFLPPRFSQSLIGKLEDETHVRPVYLFMGDPKRPDSESFKAYDGVRSIISNADESRLYFTAKGGAGPKKNNIRFFSLHGIDPRDPRDDIRWSRSRIFDAAITPDGSKLLATDYDNKRLLVLDPETLEVRKSLPTNPFPMFIVMDKTHKRVFVTHEGIGFIIAYRLPDVERINKKLTFSAPIAAAIDWNSGEMYTANWLFPFMLSELDMYDMSARRVKFPLSFAGTGVALDFTRDRVYVSNILSGKVAAVDRETFRSAGKLDSLPGIRPVVVDEKRKLIYVGNMMEPYLRVYGYDHRLLARVYIGRNCRAIYLTPKTNRLLAGSSLGVLEVNVDNLLKNKR